MIGYLAVYIKIVILLASLTFCYKAIGISSHLTPHTLVPSVESLYMYIWIVLMLQRVCEVSSASAINGMGCSPQ